MNKTLMLFTVTASLIGSALPSSAAVVSYTDTSLNGSSWGTQYSESRDFDSRTFSVQSGDPLQFEARYEFNLLSTASFQEFSSIFSGNVNVTWRDFGATDGIQLYTSGGSLVDTSWTYSYAKAAWETIESPLSLAAGSYYILLAGTLTARTAGTHTATLSGNMTMEVPNPVTAVPGPIAGAGIPALMALGGFVWAHRRKAAAVA